MDGVFGLFGRPDGLKRFHAEDVHLGMVEAPTHRRRLDDERPRSIARIECGDGFAETIPLMERSERDGAIAHFYALRLSATQLERMTGIGMKEAASASARAAYPLMGSFFGSVEEGVRRRRRLSDVVIETSFIHPVEDPKEQREWGRTCHLM